MYLWDRIEETALWIEKSIGDFKPQVGIILGTGLGKLADEIKQTAILEYENIPNFPVSTVESHAGKLIFGELAGKKVVAMQGRFHLYEGYNMDQVTFPVRVFKRLGVETLIVSNACGGINENLKAGDIMVISDHINLLGLSPLMGKNDERLGARFPDMSEPYSKRLIEIALKTGLEMGLNIKRGVYAVTMGPNLETAAEYRFLEIIGADVIGMSTVPEVIVAVHARLKVLGLSVITDECRPDNLKPVSLEKIIAVSESAEPKLVNLIRKVLEKI